jgi:hypothetical protein
MISATVTKWGLQSIPFVLTPINVYEFHTNTPISGEKKGCEFGRLSVVCYLREKMIKCL